jgi:predicted permease
MEWSTHVRNEFVRHGKQVDESVVEELAQHAAAAFEEARADGLSSDDAEAQVLGLVMSWCTATTGPQRIDRAPLIESAPAGSSMFAGLVLDFRQAIRLLRRQPVVACVSILMIALAIGVTSALFSIVNGVLLKPLPWKAANRLVRVYEERSGMIARDSLAHALTNVTYNAWADGSRTIDGVAGWLEGELMLGGDAGLERVAYAAVTPTLFPLLGEVPLLGATFGDDDARANNTVILSYGFWQERFGGARDVLGQSITLGGRSRAIVAVMPRGFEFPTGEARLWTPLDVPPAYQPGTDRRRLIFQFNGLARLKPGATADQAAAEGAARLNAVPLPDLEWMLPPLFGTKGPYKVAAIDMRDFVVQDVKPALWILLAAGTLLFAAAIGTVINLQLAQATARRREVAIRSAIGAGTGRLARQLFVESTTVVAIGGTLGFALAAFLIRLLPALVPSDFPRVQHVDADARVLLLATGLTLAVSLFLGLLPARMARRVTLTSTLTEDGSAPIGQTLRSPAARSRGLIITAQVAIAAVLLVAGALLSTSFTRLLDADRGYSPANLLTARIGFLTAGLPPGTRATVYREILERVAVLRGVSHVGLTDRLPVGTADWSTRVLLNAQDQKAPDSEVDTVYRIVSEHYFRSMGIRLMSGRGFTAQDTVSSEPVVVVNQTFARQYLSGDPLGKMIAPDLEQYRRGARWWRVVGVVADVRNDSITQPVKPELYATTGQTTNFVGQFLTVRTEGDPAALATDLRAIVRSASGNAAIDQVITMEGRLMATLARPRLYAILIGGFSSFALVIAVAGLFGGLSYGVAQRRREIGIRTALGATPRDIAGLVLRQGAFMTLSGLAVGFLVAAWTGRYLSGFLFGVTPADPVTFVLVGVAVTAIAAVACGIPAARAAKVDPIQALKH